MATIVLTDEAGTPATPSAGTTTVYTSGGVLYVINPSGVATTPVLASSLTTDGDMLYRNGAGSVTRLPIGTPGQALVATTVGPDTLPVWTTLTAASVGALASSLFTADGDLLYRDGSSTPAALPIGTPGQALIATTVGPDTLPVWTTLTAASVGALASSLFTADGDLLYRDGSSTPAALPIGTPGQFLVATTVGPDTLPVWTTVTPTPPPAMIPLGGYSSVDGTMGTAVVGGSPFALTASDYDVPGRATTFTFVLGGSVAANSPPDTGTVVLWDITLGAAVATISVTSNTPATSHGTAFVPLGGARTYEVRASVAPGVGVGNYVIINNAAIRVTWA